MRKSHHHDKDLSLIGQILHVKSTNLLIYDQKINLIFPRMMVMMINHQIHLRYFSFTIHIMIKLLK